MNTQDERKAFESQECVKEVLPFTGFSVVNNHYYIKKNGLSQSGIEWLNGGWQMWQAATIRAEEKLKGCMVVPKDQTEDWYLDPDEYMWFDHDGIDSTLCDMNIGEVTAIEHKEYLITVSNTIYAAKVWDSENEDVGFWEFFKTEAEAEKAAAHCKAMVEAARGGNE